MATFNQAIDTDRVSLKGGNIVLSCSCREFLKAVLHTLISGHCGTSKLHFQTGTIHTIINMIPRLYHEFLPERGVWCYCTLLMFSVISQQWSYVNNKIKWFVLFWLYVQRAIQRHTAVCYLEIALMKVLIVHLNTKCTQGKIYVRKNK